MAGHAAGGGAAAGSGHGGVGGAGLAAPAVPRWDGFPPEEDLVWSLLFLFFSRFVVLVEYTPATAEHSALSLLYTWPGTLFSAALEGDVPQLEAIIAHQRAAAAAAAAKSSAEEGNEDEEEEEEEAVAELLAGKDEWGLQPLHYAAGEGQVREKVAVNCLMISTRVRSCVPGDDQLNPKAPHAPPQKKHRRRLSSSSWTRAGRPRPRPGPWTHHCTTRRRRYDFTG